ncbi:MAG: hypothetical protein AAF587_01225 [Bacteroidota bacterium]
MKKRKKILVNASMRDGALGAVAGQVFEAKILGAGVDEGLPDLDAASVVDAQVSVPEAPVAGGIHDQMTFDEAFSSARNELGAGGVFFWRGNVYGTYFEEEWESLSNDARQTYWESLPQNDSDIPVAELLGGTDMEQAMSVAKEMKEEIVDESVEVVAAEVVDGLAGDGGEQDFANEEIFHEEGDSDTDAEDMDWVDW